MSEKFGIVSLRVDQDCIAVLTIDDPNAPVNTTNDAYHESMAQAVEYLAEKKSDLTGAIITSGKKSFGVGGDIKDMVTATRSDAAKYFEYVEGMKAGLRALETLGIPVVAALNGSAFGGSFEIALAAHHRIAIDDERSQFGLPEVTLGLLPGLGGLTRTVRMFGVQKALTEVLLSGTRFSAAEAQQAGLPR